VAVTFVCLNLAGCMIIAGDNPPATHRPNTLGQELRELKAARDEGAINDDEYHSAKEKLLASSGKR
jgi:hypothetical protein